MLTLRSDEKDFRGLSHFLMSSVFAADIKVGFVTTLTTPAAVIGEDMKNAVKLALEHLNGKAGSHKIEVVFGDDGFAPDTGKQVTDRLLKQDKVDIIADSLQLNLRPLIRFIFFFVIFGKSFINKTTLLDVDIVIILSNCISNRFSNSSNNLLSSNSNKS